MGRRVRKREVLRPDQRWAGVMAQWERIGEAEVRRRAAAAALLVTVGAAAALEQLDADAPTVQREGQLGLF